jgi:3-hydroxyisobutyrate dehydrogenase
MHSDDDSDLVREVIGWYLTGHATGVASWMTRAFLPTAHVEGIRDDRFTSWTLDEYRALFDGTPAADEATRTRTIDWIEVSGDAATAKATLVHGPNTFVDYFLLLKVDGRWAIANKIYRRIDGS